MAPRELELVLREAGAATAREMLLEAGVLTAAQLQARGFLQRVVSEAELLREVERSVSRISSLAPQAARLNKQALRVLQPPAPEAKVRLLAQAYAYADSAEHREGIAAFLAKRPADFSLPIP
jgi:enoyl-CoA hydratase/carnithine racemase